MPPCGLRIWVTSLRARPFLRKCVYGVDLQVNTFIWCHRLTLCVKSHSCFVFLSELCSFLDIVVIEPLHARKFLRFANAVQLKLQTLIF